MANRPVTSTGTFTPGADFGDTLYPQVHRNARTGDDMVSVFGRPTSLVDWPRGRLYIQQCAYVPKKQISIPYMESTRSKTLWRKKPDIRAFAVPCLTPTFVPHAGGIVQYIELRVL